MADHTPGPWGHRQGVVFDSGCEVICVAHISEADAVLIASAPDMASRISELEAERKAYRQALDFYARAQFEGGGVYGAFKNEYRFDTGDLARAALADSEGMS